MVVYGGDMELILKPNSEQSCRDCNKKIWRTEPRFKATEGHYCTYHGRIKSLHDRNMQWIKENAHNINKSKGIVSNIINKIYNWMER